MVISAKEDPMSFRAPATLLCSAFLAGASLLAQAPPPPATQLREAQVTRREARQQRRIAQGVASGALTPKETARLERQEGRIDRHIARAEADGKMTAQESARINRQENRESRRIYRKKHNALAAPQP
jgi:hypothetical protein